MTHVPKTSKELDNAIEDDRRYQVSLLCSNFSSLRVRKKKKNKATLCLT